MFTSFIKVLYRFMLAALPIYRFWQMHDAELATSSYEQNIFIIICFTSIASYWLVLELGQRSVSLIVFSIISFIGVLSLEVIYRILLDYSDFLIEVIGVELFAIRIFAIACLFQGLIFLIPFYFRGEEV